MREELRATSDKAIREGLSEEVTFEPRLERSEGPVGEKAFQADGTAYVDV